jgi:hypothetical protein
LCGWPSFELGLQVTAVSKKRTKRTRTTIAQRAKNFVFLRLLLLGSGLLQPPLTSALRAMASVPQGDARKVAHTVIKTAEIKIQTG